MTVRNVPVESPEAIAQSGAKILVAHLGAHKTATSLVQKYFKDKKDYYDDQGVLALTRSEVSPFISWGDQIMENPWKFNKFLHSKAKRATGKYILMSNENALGRPFKERPGLYPDHTRIIPAFAKVMHGFQPRIVYSIRPQWEFLESYYLQRVQQGYFLTFSQYVAEIDLKQISWLPLIAQLREAFGADNVLVFDFGLIRKGQEVFLSEFVKRAISPDVTPDLNYGQVHNASLSDRGLQMALRINPLLKPDETGIIRRFLQENFSNLTEPRPTLMSEVMRTELKERYADEYKSLVGEG